MLVSVCRAKIHNAMVTGVELEYEGSLTIDGALMDEAGILEYEKVLVSNLANGNRFETYVIRASKNSGAVVLNGATAHLGKVGDRIIVFAFASMEPEKARNFHPSIIVLGEGNKIVTKRT
ncbi:MAG: aspartate 1-decarboxylase [Candidatus Glassbacteria bacterium]